MSEARPRGHVIQGWTPPPLPERGTLTGRHVRLKPLDAEAHAALLYHAYDGHDHVWDYMPVGPFASSAQFHRWMRDITASPDHVFFAIYDIRAEAYGGLASYLRIKPQAGSIEVGYIAMAPPLQRTVAATDKDTARFHIAGAYFNAERDALLNPAPGFFAPAYVAIIKLDADASIQVVLR
jgi:hypothetical protein